MRSKRHKESIGSTILFDWIIPIAAAVVIAILITKFLLFKVYIPSESMEPTISKGDQLFVTRIYNRDKIKRGDILVFDSKELDDLLIKRVIGLPGDSIDIIEGTVIINGEALKDDYVAYPQSFNGHYEVPEGMYFFLGDNRANSKDSRYWDNPYIDGKDIRGKAQIRVYPFTNIGFIK